MPSVQAFIARHPGADEGRAPEHDAGFGLWAVAQHLLNSFLMIFIIRSGIQILSDHPRLYWTRHSTPGKDWFRIQKPVPDDPLWTAKQDSITLPGQVGLPGIRHSIGLARWWHLGTDMVWLLNGLVFFALLFATPHWRRLVPTSWDVFPNALSVLIQYLSLDWPSDNGWVAYNGLQLLAYFVTVFVAAPLALAHGARHVAGTFDPLPADQQAVEHPDRPLAALPRARLVPALHRPARDVRLHDRPPAQPEPHLRRTERPAAGSGSGSSQRRWR